MNMKLTPLLISLTYSRAAAKRAPRHNIRHMAFISSFVGPSKRLYSTFPLQTSSLVRPVSGASFGTRFMATGSTSELMYEPPLVSISDAHDSGNGEFVSAEVVNDDECDVRVTVKIKPDPYSYLESKTFFQYFFFRSTLHLTSPQLESLLSTKDANSKIRVQYILENAGQAAYSQAFKGYSTFVSNSPFEPDSWNRVGNTRYDEDNGWLIWNHEVMVDDNRSIYFSYFPPYSYERHLGLVARCSELPECKVHSLGQTLSGREIECLTIGKGPRTVWIIHRQHPGESMASYFAEGLLTRLLGLDDEWDRLAQKAKELYTFRIVPNVNPDGSVGGFLRTNAAGSNLNREWAPSTAPVDPSGSENDEKCDVAYKAPTLERSPEVYHILHHMDQTGCDAFLDVHGDEDLPFNFLAGSQGMPNWDKRLEALHGAFLAAYERANSDMQAKVSYDPDKPNEGMKNICSNQIAIRYNCFSGTLEMPFKELWQKDGWGPERARRLGASVLDPLCYIWPHLRDDKPFWEGLRPEDAYVHPSSHYEK